MKFNTDDMEWPTFLDEYEKLVFRMTIPRLASSIFIEILRGLFDHENFEYFFKKYIVIFGFKLKNDICNLKVVFDHELNE